MTMAYTYRDEEYLRRRQAEAGAAQASTQLYPCADGVMRTAGDKAAWERAQQYLIGADSPPKDQ